MSSIETCCPLCDVNGFEPLWQYHYLTNGCCRECGHIYSVGEYSEDYTLFGQLIPSREFLDPAHPLFQIAKHRSEVISGFTTVQQGNLLEIGCGYGHFLQTMSDQGYDVYGVEPSEIETSFAREHFHLSHIQSSEYGNFTSSGFRGMGKSFNIIAAFHVLEHVVDPRRFLQSIYSDLTSGGMLALAVPNLYSLHHDLHELNFIAKGLHRHTFSPQRLSRLLEETGFTICYFEDEPYTHMSPSSMLILAGRQETAKRPLIPIHDITEPACDVMRRFHSELDLLTARINEKVHMWHVTGECTAIYGAGHHTQALIELCGLTKETISCIIDDDRTKWNKHLYGIDIVSPGSQEAISCTRVLVSSLASEEKILARLNHDYPTIPVYGIYRDFTTTNVE